jgi:citrate synthase
MNIHLTKSQIGLDGVPAAETVLSHVDGERGELIIAGEHVAELASRSSFEGVTARLWTAATGRPLAEADVRKSLGAARERAFARLADLLRRRAACRSSTAFAPPSQGCGPRTGWIMRQPLSARSP